MNKKASTTVFLSVIFVSMALAVIASIEICREMTIKSECMVFGKVWAKAILSEYDRFLLEDYGIMAYQGPDIVVASKINTYAQYSIDDKLGIRLKRSGAELDGYEISIPSNFKKALKDAFVVESFDTLLNSEGRIKRGDLDEGENRVINNTVVLDTLPSNGIRSSIGVAAISDYLENGSISGYIKDKAVGAAVEMGFIRKYFDNYLYLSGGEDSYFRNEWEYIVNGDSNDKRNLEDCKRKIFLIRNALNLAYLAKDSEKQLLLSTVSQSLSPGPGGVLIQAVLTEAWAAAESKYDLDQLLDDQKIPLIKTEASWHTDLDGIINSSDVIKKLDDEALENLDEAREIVKESNTAGGVLSEIVEGQGYEDYLMLLMLAVPENTRLLRIMDIVQTNMKYRYYADFNLEEYFIGVRFNVNANGRTYEFEDAYK